MPQGVETYLRALPVTDTVRADAWDAVYASSREERERRMRALPLLPEQRAQLLTMGDQALGDQALPPPRTTTTVRPSSEQSFASEVADVGIGAAKGSGTSITGLGELVHMIPGVSRGVDWLYGTPGLSQASFRDARQRLAPTTPAQQAGFFVEQLAELAVPATKVAKTLKGASTLVRLGAEGMLGGAGAAIQTGDPWAAPAGAAFGMVVPAGLAGLRAARQSAGVLAAGARTGGTVGALGALARRALPEQPRTLITQALKPRNTQRAFEPAVDKALPIIAQAVQAPIRTIDDLIAGVRSAKRMVQTDLDVLRGAGAPLSIDLAPLADAAERAITTKVRRLDPDLTNTLVAKAQRWRQRVSLDEAEDMLRTTNAELEGFYAKMPWAQRAAVLSDPVAAELDTTARALRVAIDDALDTAVSGMGDSAKTLRRQYGALIEMGTTAERRALVAKRQQPVSLSEQIAATGAMANRASGIVRAGAGMLHGSPMEVGRGLADIVGGTLQRASARAIKEAQTTDALIERAFDQFQRGVSTGRLAGYQRVPLPTPGQIVGGWQQTGGGRRALPAGPSAIPLGPGGGAGAPARPVSMRVPSNPTIVRDPVTGRAQELVSSRTPSAGQYEGGFVRPGGVDVPPPPPTSVPARYTLQRGPGGRIQKVYTGEVITPRTVQGRAPSPSRVPRGAVVTFGPDEPFAGQRWTRDPRTDELIRLP